LVLRGLVGSLDGKKLIRGMVGGEGGKALELGIALAEDFLSRGADDILREIYEGEIAPEL
jgi:hydroxymethylbilane synthase